ncbi:MULTISPECIES: bestrophin family protein [Elizabethkingia]|nr:MULTISPECIES: bestrophin family ion channel [Elizabethkingia]AQX90570.1 multidrug transporter [Elizabethkingia anophelis]EHM7981709.1 multidrug transporter [Elizabethkingia anophelis]EHM8032207.1 multidrug transporter [Elizabethkingia anophelis]EHZ9535161.1 multidrug transporter [Elizabethkingia anophelis]EKU3673071.1 multidrug transporter [Elizabethkingia anophelis]
MNIGSHYKLYHFIPWTRIKIYKMLILSIVPTALFYFLDWKWLAIPWVPVALLGTAAAFISGFKNTQTYNRSWEARQIYGAIINNSRSFGIQVKDFIRTEKTVEKDLHQQIIYRHFAWLTALRFQLRETKSWEHVKTKSYNKEYLQYYKVPEWESKLENELKEFLDTSEFHYVLSTKNRATQIIALQSSHLRALNEEGKISDYNYTALENQLKELYDQQGKCERIKNFPYPRQFSSINLYFTNALCFLLPLGFLGEFSKMTEKFGDNIVWLTIPFSVLLGWVFLVLEQIGESTENPFEGNANDIPITQISRNIEIDLREMLGETELPPAINPIDNIVM